MQRGFKELRISEQAFAVAMRYKKLFDRNKLQQIDEELMLIEGKKVQSPLGTENEKTDKMSITADEYGFGRNTIARLLRINELTDELKAKVNDGNIKIRPAVELSYIPEEMQAMLVKVMSEQEVSVIDMKMAKQLREISASYASPSEEIIAEVLNGTYRAEEKPVKEKGEKVTIPKATYSRYLGSYSKKEANLIIEKALAYYFENKEGGMAAC